MAGQAPHPDVTTPAAQTSSGATDRGSRAGRPRLLWALGCAAVLLLVAAAAVIAFRLGGAGRDAGTAAATPTAAATTPPSVPDLFRLVGPSVVVVQTSQQSLGTGVIAGQDGTILTADHVVSGGGTITITFSDGTQTAAALASADPARDIAMLTPAALPEVLVPAVLGGEATVGAPVVAIGNPLGLAYSVSTGVVSGLDREASTDIGTFSGLIQFDASVNPGSSGGPLLDAQGSVIGIVVSIADPSGDDSFAGIGFAVPIGAALGGPGAGEGPQI